jgi:hypothetical protein
MRRRTVNTPDPYQASGGPSSPGRWNRYSYTRGDPVNRCDPQGLEDIGDGYDDDGSGTVIPDSLIADGCDNPTAIMTLIAGGAQSNIASDCPQYIPYFIDPELNVQASPSCTIEVFNRPIEATHGVNFPGAQHGYIEFIDASDDDYYAEGTKSGSILTAFAGPAAGQLPKDIPSDDHIDGTLSGSQVCGWLTTLESDAAKVNAANISYHWYGPNSSSVLRYMLNSLPITSWFSMPWMVGYGSPLPGLP